MKRASRQGMDFVKTLWRTDAPLTAVGLLMIVALVASAIGVLFDPRTITGAPAWLKPAKFAVSIAIYCFTLAWVFSYLPSWIRTRRVVGVLTAAVFIVEMTIIALQAWRGTTSHFNVDKPLDATLFGIMGFAIAVQTLASIAVAVALWRQPFVFDRTLGWALRLGFTITIIGASTGGLMTTPTEAQLAEARATHHLVRSGAHTVGAPDGGPGLPGTGWSVQHGDIRVPHFMGMHGLQALPLILFVFRRRIAVGNQSRFVIASAASYLGLFAILLAQALRGQSLIAPDASTLAMFSAWATATAIAMWSTLRPRANAHAMANVAAW